MTPVPSVARGPCQAPHPSRLGARRREQYEMYDGLHTFPSNPSGAFLLDFWKRRSGVAFSRSGMIQEAWHFWGSEGYLLRSTVEVGLQDKIQG